MGILIGISGCSGSGKSTFAKALMDKLGDKKLAFINSDVFFKEPKPKMISPLSGEVYDDYNSPETLDIVKMMAEVENQLSKNEVVLCEGVLLFCFEEFRKKADTLIYIDANIETRLARRLTRNTNWGMDFRDVLEYYMESARFSEKKNTDASKMFSDILVNSEHDFSKSVLIIEAYIRSLI